MRILALAILLSIPSIALAQEQSTFIREGDPAPFDGTLFNVAATARIGELAVELEFEKKSCDERVEFEKSLLDARYSSRIELLDLKYDTLEHRYDSLLATSDEQIDILLKGQQQARKPKTGAFAAGVGVGIAVALGTGFVWSKMAPVE